MPTKELTRVVWLIYSNGVLLDRRATSLEIKKGLFACSKERQILEFCKARYFQYEWDQDMSVNGTTEFLGRINGELRIRAWAE